MTSFNYLILLDASRGQTTSTCDIISTSLTTLTTDGGVIFNGTQNMIIYCLCMRNNVAVAGARWFFPNGTQVRTEAHNLLDLMIHIIRILFLVYWSFGSLFTLIIAHTVVDPVNFFMMYYQVLVLL